MTRLNTHFLVKGISLLNSVVSSSSSVQFKNICAIKSMISLEMKCPQLSKPEEWQGTKTPSVTERRNKTWEKTDSVRGTVPFWPDELVVCSNLFPDGGLGDEVLTGDLSLGLI